MRLSGGAPRRIGDGHALAISAGGDRIAFVKDGEIWSASLRDTKPAAQLMHTRGRASELRWSPKGEKLAFVSNRGDHNFIGVYDATAKTLRYLSPSVDWDSSPVWSPDGARVAFIRMPTSSRKPEFGANRTESPWSIVVASVATGDGKEIWKAEEGVGSAFRDIVSDAQLMWAQSDYIVFPWERDGWTHLYKVSANGSDVGAAHAGRLRGRARIAVARSRSGVLLVESGRHRPPAHLARGRGRAASWRR